MITVSVLINGKPLFTRSAVNISEDEGKKYGEGKQVYRVDDGKKIRHNYEDGAIVLAKKLLDTIHEV